MMQNHSLPTPLDGIGLALSSESTARWARGRPKACFVFVHGYGGRAVATWGDFPDMAMEHPDYSEVDLIFLGYESRSRPALYSSGVIFQSVEFLNERTHEFLSRVGGPERMPDFTYDEVVLVGHSLGGAIVRDVAMNAKMLEKPWAEKLRLALFAPAHRGAMIISLFRMGMGFFYTGLPKALAIYKSPVLRDLEEGSTFLTNLLETAQSIGPHCTTQARFIAHASDDPVVVREQFFRDPPIVPYEGKDHISCCKPIKLVFDKPIEDLTRVIS